MTDILEALFTAADNHAQDSCEPDHAVGDLQDMMRLAWSAMSVRQRLQLLRNPELGALLEDGARGEFSGKSLAAELTMQLAAMECVVVAAGYVISEAGYCWHSSAGRSSVFDTRDDAIADAYANSRM
jgi:hypothetical protein